MSGYDSMAISEFFRSGMVNAGLCRIISRGSMETVLGEQRFQMSGCTDQDCVVKMGKLLNAEKVISGSIVSFNEEYYINAKVIDVETGEIQYSEQVKCKDKAELPKKAEELAWVVSGKISKNKLMLHDASKDRKKYAIYVYAATPMLRFPGDTNTLKGFAGGDDLYLKVNKSNSGPVSGIGLKIFPWKNISLDIEMINSGETIVINTTDLVTNISKEFMIDRQNEQHFALNYLFNPDNNTNYSIGGGVLIPSISSLYGPIDGNYGYDRINSSEQNIYYVESSINRKITNNLDIAFDLLFPLQNSTDYIKFGMARTHNNVESTSEFIVKQELPIAFQLSVSYHFNLKFLVTSIASLF